MGLNEIGVRSWRHGSIGVDSCRMDGNTDPPSDVTAMDSENNERSKTQQNSNDMTNTASSGTTTSSATYSTTQSDQPTEYCSQRSIRAGSVSPLPTNSSSLSSSSSSLSSSSSTSPLQPGCGCVAATVLEPDEITISITPTTGGQFDLTVDRTDTVENLKKIISKRLKVAKERVCLLHRERLVY